MYRTLAIIRIYKMVKSIVQYSDSNVPMDPVQLTAHETNVRLIKLNDEKKHIMNRLFDITKKTKKINRILSILSIVSYCLGFINIIIPICIATFSTSKYFELVVIIITTLIATCQKLNSNYSSVKDRYIKTKSAGDAALSMFNDQIEKAISDNEITPEEYDMIMCKLQLAKDSIDNEGEHISSRLRECLLEEGMKMGERRERDKILQKL